MPYQHLFLEIEDQVAVVTLNRPSKLNAISPDLHEEMMGVCRQLQEDEGVRVVIWTGAGRGFCSGVDLTASRAQGEYQTRSERIDEYGWVGRQAIEIYRNLNKPTIAAINGVAAGAGMLAYSFGHRRAYDRVLREHLLSVGTAWVPGGAGLSLSGRF